MLSMSEILIVSFHKIPLPVGVHRPDRRAPPRGAPRVAHREVHGRCAARQLRGRSELHEPLGGATSPKGYVAWVRSSEPDQIGPSLELLASDQSRGFVLRRLLNHGRKPR